MWPFRRKPDSSFETLAALQRELRVRLEDVEDRLMKLEERHKSLQGKIYAHKLHKPPEEPASNVTALNPRERKDQLLTQLGFKPGKPFNHSE